MLLAVHDAVAAAPAAFIIGVGIGFWVGGRFVIRRHGDEHLVVPNRREEDGNGDDPPRVRRRK